MLFLLALPEEYLKYEALAAVPTCPRHDGCQVGSCEGGPNTERAAGLENLEIHEVLGGS